MRETNKKICVKAFSTLFVVIIVLGVGSTSVVTGMPNVVMAVDMETADMMAENRAVEEAEKRKTAVSENDREIENER